MSKSIICLAMLISLFGNYTVLKLVKTVWRFRNGHTLHDSHRLHDRKSIYLFT